MENKEYPILFSTDMVRAILDGTKTQTRRIIKPQPYFGKNDVWQWHYKKEGTLPKYGFVNPSKIPYYIIADNSKYGTKGDTLWVRETCQWEGETSYKDAVPVGQWWYKADEGRVWEQGPAKWKPSIFMPKRACRIRLKIKGITVERLNDISEADALAEGIRTTLVEGYRMSYDYFRDDFGLYEPVKSFKTLWQSINGINSWKQNPFVYKIEFEIEK